MTVQDDFRRLLEVDRMIADLTRERAELSTRVYDEIVETLNARVPREFPTRIAALQFILEVSGRPEHARTLAALLAGYGYVEPDDRSVSATLRRYSAEGRIFRAYGGNKFGLLAWDQK